VFDIVVTVVFQNVFFWISFKLYVIAYILGFNTGGKKFGEFAGFSLEKIPIF
jgi:hypothetical protein